jgi:hypothetical protein
VAVLVEGPAVELDDQAVLGEQGINLVATDVGIDQRYGEAVGGAEAQERVLKLRAGGYSGVEDGGQKPVAGMVGEPL